MTYKSIPTIVCQDCGEKSYGWDITAGDTRCAHCGSERTVRVDEKKMKPTPGPWKARIVAGSIWGIYTEHLSPMLAKVAGARENNKANARLIAAAPDLLAALTIAARCWETYAAEERAMQDLPSLPDASDAEAKRWQEIKAMLRRLGVDVDS